MSRKPIVMNEKVKEIQPAVTESAVDQYAELREKVNRYTAAKEAAKAYNNDIKLGDEIKEFCVARGIRQFKGEEFQVTVTVTPNQYIDDDKALEILKKKLNEEQLKQVVKTREYIDDDALENLIYHNQVPKNILAPAMVEGKPSTRITYKKLK